MSGRILFDALIDRLHSAGIPERQGARMASYEQFNDVAELEQLIETHNQLWQSFDYASEEAQFDLMGRLLVEAFERADAPVDLSLAVKCSEIMKALIADEPGFKPPGLQTPLPASLLERGDLGASLNQRIEFLSNPDVQEQLFDSLVRIFTELFDRLPANCFVDEERQINYLTTDALSLIKDPLEFMTALLSYFISREELQENELFTKLSKQLYRNVLEASGVIIDPDRPLIDHDAKRPVFPKDCSKLSLSDVVRKYFVHTPLADLFTIALPFPLPEEARFEHMHILAGTGHGKTQTLQHLIVSDLTRPKEQVPSMVILDSQGDMINTLKRLSLFDPNREGSLADRLLIVDPSDVAFAPALNLFDIQSDRVKDYNQRDREQVLAGIIEIYDYIFGGLLGAELTQKQAMVFRFLAQLMLAIPGSTIHTLRDLLDDATPYMDAIAALPETARGFFEKQFFTKSYHATREQILRRLYGVLQNPSFERMFATSANRLDLFDVLNKGGIVLVNTSKDFLKTESSSIFGRYIIALTLKAAFERATLPQDQRRPTFLWIDEASEYFDDNIDNLLIQARKFKLGIIMAHQYLGQLSRNLPASLMTNTSIKFAGGLSDRDARVMAPEMRTNSEFLTSMTKARDQTEFAAFVRNHTAQAIPLSIPFGTAENMEQIPYESFDQLLTASRQKLSFVQTSMEPEKSLPTDVTTKSDNDEIWEPMN